MVRAAHGPRTMYRRGQRWDRATTWCGGLVAPLLLPFGFRVHVGKIRDWVFVLCNSEDISCVGFLKRKTAKKQETGTGHLVNRLVQENVNKCNKMHIKHVTNDII